MPGTSSDERDAGAAKPRYAHTVIYAHRADGDTWLQVLSSNRRRLRVRRNGRPDARGPVPVIVGTDQDAVALARLRQAWITSLQGKAGALGVELLVASQEAHADLQRIARLYAELDEAAEKLLAATQTVIYGPDVLRHLPDPKNTKIELLHHGLWGYEYLLADGRDPATRYSVRDLPAYWLSLGLSPDIGSVRLEACCSGDAAPREHLISYPRGYYGPPSAKHLAPAQMLADAMEQAGFTSPRVTGYQGIGICIINYLSKNDVYIGETWAEDVSLPEGPYAVRVGTEDEGARVDIARRSDVAMVFEPRDPNRRRKALRYDRAYLYAARWEENTFEVALEENVRRLAKWIDSGSLKPRGPIPLLAKDEQEKETLSALRRQRMRALRREVQAARGERRNCAQALGDASLSGAARDEMQQKIDDLDFTIKERSFYMAAAEATDIDEWETMIAVSDAEQKSEAQIEEMRTAQLDKTKLYIVPHGRTASGFRPADLSSDLAQPFLSAGVTPYIGSFRLLNNGSADATRRRKFVANPAEYSGSGPRRRLAPAQELANGLHEAGFLRPRVTGYQGRGVSWAASKHSINAAPDAPNPPAGARHQGWGRRSIAPPHALRTLPGDTSQWKRRSEAGKVFAPKRGLALAFPGS